MMWFLVVCILQFTTLTYGWAAPPVGYYDGVEDCVGQELKRQLHQAVLDHEIIPYSSDRYDVRDAIEQLDENPTDPSQVRLLYSDAVMAKASWPDYNREHVWPQSLGATNRTPAHSDLHHIFACDSNVNSARGNRRFDECASDCNVHQDAPQAAATATAWEPPDHQKGDVARALFYMDVRYEGDRADEPDLRLVEWGVTPGCNCMGRLSTLLRWHEDDPVDDRERARNEAAFEIQGNRNPFIDNPDWVDNIWSHLEEEERDLWPQWDPLLVQPWFNEIHYENAGVDADEGFEIAGPAGTNLTGWTVALYNGRDERIYAEVALEGIIDEEQAGFGALWFAVPHLQNGGHDGLALVRPDGHVVAFISYEGQLEAVDGPAQGQLSSDIGLEENEDTEVASSLQLAGRGGRYDDFLWAQAQRSPGDLNADQELFRSAPLLHRLPVTDVPEFAPAPELQPMLWWLRPWERLFTLLP